MRRGACKKNQINTGGGGLASLAPSAYRPVIESPMTDTKGFNEIIDLFPDIRYKRSSRPGQVETVEDLSRHVSSTRKGN